MNLLLADDDLELSGMLAEYLVSEGFAVHVVHDGESAASLALSGDYQLAVLDIMMPGPDGIEALRRIRKSSCLPVIMLTARGDDVERVLGLELGADDYVAKPCTPRELAARVRAIMRRVQPGGQQPPLSAGKLVMWTENRRVEWQGSPLKLTSTQFNILEVLLGNAGKVVSKKELCERALGRPLERFDRSIDVHLSCLRTKLGEGAGMIHTVRTMGYQITKE